MNKPITAAILSCRGTSLSDDEKYLFDRINPLGINLFGRNIASKTQIKQLIKEIRETIGREDVLIAVDQEGGRVRRLAEPEFRSYAHAITLGRLRQPEARTAATLQARLISADLRETGFNLNYAPVLDTLFPQTSAVLKSRTFGSDTQTIISLGKAMVDEYIDNGICPCIKHLPGHGRAAVDPHLNLPILDNPLSELEVDFAPFRSLNHTPAGMTAHIVIKAIDDKLPMTMSAKAIKTVIRGLIGFRGLLISDAVDMHALPGNIAERAAAALQAGCDCICYALGNYSELQKLADVCPPLTDAALERLQTIKNIITAKITFPNIENYANQYKNIVGTIEPYLDDYDATEVLNKMKQ